MNKILALLALLLAATCSFIGSASAQNKPTPQARESMFKYEIASFLYQDASEPAKTLVKGRDDEELSGTLLYQAAVANSDNETNPIATVHLNIVSQYWQNGQSEQGGVGQEYGGILSRILHSLRHSQAGEGVTFAGTAYGTVHHNGRTVSFVTGLEQVTVQHLTGKQFEISTVVAARLFKRNITLDLGGSQEDSSTSFVALIKETARQEFFAKIPLAVTAALASLGIYSLEENEPNHRVTSARVAPDGSEILLIGDLHMNLYIGKPVSVSVTFVDETEPSDLPCTVFRIGGGNCTVIPAKRFIGTKFHVNLDAEIIPTGR